MKTSRFTDSQIIAILSNATFYKWRSKFGGMDASLMARMKELTETGPRRLTSTFSVL